MHNRHTYTQIHTHTHTYMPLDVLCLWLPQLERLMRGISSGVAGGSTLALAWKALSVIDRPPPGDPCSLCQALIGAPPLLDWFSFLLGLIAGVLIFAFIELVVTLRWLLVSLVRTQEAPAEASTPRRAKPLYKIL